MKDNMATTSKPFRTSPNAIHKLQNILQRMAESNGNVVAERIWREEDVERYCIYIFFSFFIYDGLTSLSLVKQVIKSSINCLRFATETLRFSQETRGWNSWKSFTKQSISWRHRWRSASSISVNASPIEPSSTFLTNFSFSSSKWPRQACQIWWGCRWCAENSD